MLKEMEVKTGRAWGTTPCGGTAKGGVVWLMENNNGGETGRRLVREIWKQVILVRAPAFPTHAVYENESLDRRE